jgi:transposase
MKFIQRSNPNQIEVFCLEQAIDSDNIVRLIHLFVSSLNMSEFGFKTDFVENGRPAYHPSDLLRLYLYGYLNKNRSSRDLEKECKRNIEVMWLMGNLRPDHNTIANFRRDNPKAIKKVFRSTVKLAKHFELIGGELLAGDSTKLRAQNGKKRNFNSKKIEWHLNYIETRLEEYNTILAKEDGDESKKAEARQKIKQYLDNKENYLQIQNQLKQSGDTQVSLSDPDSRQLITHNNIKPRHVEVALS